MTVAVNAFADSITNVICGFEALRLVRLHWTRTRKMMAEAKSYKDVS